MSRGLGDVYKRQGAKNAKNYVFLFVLIPNTFACFAPWRELIVFSLAEALRPQRISMFDLLLPLKPLRTLRLGEKFYVFISRKGAKVAKKIYVYFVLTQNTSACSAPLRDYIYFFLAEALRLQRTSMFDLLLPQTPLRTLRPGEKCGLEQAFQFIL